MSVDVVDSSVGAVDQKLRNQELLRAEDDSILAFYSHNGSTEGDFI